MSENENIRVRVLISGDVQGVGFRFFTKGHADDLNLTGWVQNLNGPDETDNKTLVEAVFQGTPENVEEMLKKCKEGSDLSGPTEVKRLHEYPVEFAINRNVIKGD